MLKEYKCRIETRVVFLLRNEVFGSWDYVVCGWSLKSNSNLFNGVV